MPVADEKFRGSYLLPNPPCRNVRSRDSTRHAQRAKTARIKIWLLVTFAPEQLARAPELLKTSGNAFNIKYPARMFGPRL